VPETSYDVVLTGYVAQGRDLKDVTSRFAAMFKLDATIAAHYFSGRSLVIRRDVDYQTALHYKTAVEKVGALVELKAVQKGSGENDDQETERQEGRSDPSEGERQQARYGLSEQIKVSANSASHALGAERLVSTRKRTDMPSYPPSPEDLQQVVELRIALASVLQDLLATESEDAQYTSGLIKSLIAVRHEIIRTTKALIEQRIYALESGAPLTLAIPVTIPDPDRANQLAQELRTQIDLVAQARSDAAQHSGGLIAAVKASTVAMQEQSLAMLRQHYLISKYGLSLPKPDTNAVREGTSPSTGSAQTAADATAPASLTKLFEIVKVDARITEANTSWSRYAWQLVVRSLAPAPLRLRARIEFRDSDGFVIDDHLEHNPALLR
jgi:hypothetical protein